MKSLLLIAHGSRSEQANLAVRELTQSLAKRFDADDLSHVEHCFLELAEPSIPVAIAKLVKAGTRELVVLPYFLSPGAHVVRDVPEQISAAGLEHPDVRITVLPHLGEAPELMSLIQQQVQAAI